MLVTTKIVSELNPCADRFDNFTNEYPDYSGTLREFLKLDKITYDDKVWVFTRLLDKDTLVRWSIKCAESVKHIYDNKMKDNKLDSVFETLKSIKDFNNMSENEIQLAESAARSVEAAAWWAAGAARSAARLAARSVEAATRLAAESAAEATRLAESEKQQEQLNLDLLVQVLDEKE